MISPPAPADSSVTRWLTGTPLPAAILVDVDGTLALHTDRGPFEWHRVNEDEPNWPVIVTVRNMQRAGFKVVIMSGRKEVCREATETWLKTHLWVPFEMLLMRKDGDDRFDYIVKEELYRAHVMGRYRVLNVYDDRDTVVAMWRRLGLVVFQVAEGNF